MIQSFDEPLVVVALDEGADDPAGRIEALEAMQPEALFLQRADEAPISGSCGRNLLAGAFVQYLDGLGFVGTA